MKVEKRGFQTRLPPEQVLGAIGDHFIRKGHYEPVTPTPEQIAAHARAVDLVEEFYENPYIRVMGYDWEIDVEPLETKRWVHDETEDEWLARYEAAKAAGELTPPARTPLQQALLGQVFHMYGGKAQ